MRKLHISLKDSTHEQLIMKAAESGLSLQALVERTLDREFIQLPLFRQANFENPRFKFIDLFAGIGGMRLAFESAGGRCVFTSEWDKHAQKTYLANFGDEPVGDIRKVYEEDVPDHDILVAGFPCQPFSIAGVSKKKSLGREHGFKDKTQGTLFFDVVRIIDKKRPSAFLLENVKNLVSHDKGNTFTVIRETLDEIGYDVAFKVVDARHYVPQHRERIFIVGFDRKISRKSDIFSFPTPPKAEKLIGSILEPKADTKYVLSDKLWEYLQNYARKHQEKGNGFGFGLVGPKSVARTLSARYYKDGSEILIKRARGNPRRLTPRECARLMGFPEEFKICVSDTQAYKQFGNSVAVPVVADIARAMAAHLEFLRAPDKVKRNGRLLEKEAQ